MGRSILITGANSGCGLEATRQLSVHFSSKDHGRQAAHEQGSDGSTTKIYLLCRSEAKARQAIADIGADNLEFLQFDTNDDAETIRTNIISRIPDDEMVAGVLLNAGGFGDAPSSSGRMNTRSLENKPPPGGSKKACGIAQLNIIGHAILVDELLKSGKLVSKARIVASGSEAVISPGVSMDWKDADLEGRLLGAVRTPGLDYGWMKGILALYWAAFARHHPEVYVLTVSPGAMGGTNLLAHGGATPFLRQMTRLAMFFVGSHSVQDGAKRYVDSLLDRDMSLAELSSSSSEIRTENELASGSVLMSCKGFTKDYGCITKLKKGKFVADTSLQDEAWVAVSQFL